MSHFYFFIRTVYFTTYQILITEEEIKEEPIILFQDGHYNEAVRKAAEIYEKTVKEISGGKKYGKPLMGEAFCKPDFIDLSNIKNSNQSGFQEGYMHLAMGLFAAIRNIFSHGNEAKRTPDEALEMLVYINWMYRYLKR